MAATPIRLELKADLAELERLADTVERFASSERLGAAAAGRLTVALDEVVTNAILHGRLPPDTVIMVELGLEDGLMVAAVSDPGAMFDPLAAPPEVDVAAPLADRPLGGLGLFLLRGLARDLAYRREDGRNRLTMRLSPD